eukprot:scaffold20.g7825.t1
MPSRRPSPSGQRAARSCARLAPLLLVLLVPAAVLLFATGQVPAGVLGALPHTAPHRERRLAEQQLGGAGAGGLHAPGGLQDVRLGGSLGSEQRQQLGGTGGSQDEGLGSGSDIKLRQEQERAAAAYLRTDLGGGLGAAGLQGSGDGGGDGASIVGNGAGLGGGVQSGGGGSIAGTQPSVVQQDAAGQGLRAGAGNVAPPSKALRSPTSLYRWPPSPPSPPPPPPPVADPAPGTFKFVRPRCADRGDQCPLWKQYGECRGNPGYMYYNCAASCSVCNVTYLHWNEVGQKRQIAPGVWMPTVGFGTAGLGDYTRDVVVAAIRAGYRGVDSAEAREWYREDLVGQGVWLSGVKREHMFVTSKLHPRYHGYWNTLAMHAQTLRDLRTDYVDLFLLHYPECWGSICGGVNPEGTWKDSWAAMEELVHEGSVRAIGVSNFNIAQLMELLAVAKIKPALVQSNSDPLRQDAEVQAFCRLHGITYQGYSSLGGQWLGQYSGRNPVLAHPAIGEIALRKQRTPAQVVLRWALQHNQLVVPRTTKLNRMTENLQVFDFDLSDSDMLKIDGLDGTTPVFPQDAKTQYQRTT